MPGASLGISNRYEGKNTNVAGIWEDIYDCVSYTYKLCRASPRRKGYQRAFPTSHGHAAFRDLGANVIGIRTQYKSLETRSSMYYMTINNVQTVNSNN